MAKVIYKSNIAGFDIVVTQFKTKRFTVRYGQQVKDKLSYDDAAKELGLSMFHALACEGVLDNG